MRWCCYKPRFPSEYTREEENMQIRCLWKNKKNSFVCVHIRPPQPHHHLFLSPPPYHKIRTSTGKLAQHNMLIGLELDVYLRAEKEIPLSPRMMVRRDIYALAAWVSAGCVELMWRAKWEFLTHHLLHYVISPDDHTVMFQSDQPEKSRIMPLGLGSQAV